jgi:hypothetical protein
MAPQTRRRITPSGHGPCFGYVPHPSGAPGLVWDVPGHHANYRSTI